MAYQVGKAKANAGQQGTTSVPTSGAGTGYFPGKAKQNSGNTEMMQSQTSVTPQAPQPASSLDKTISQGGLATLGARVGTGIGSAVGTGVTGLVGEGLKAYGKMGEYLTGGLTGGKVSEAAKYLASGVERAGEEIYKKPMQGTLETTGGKVGELIGTVAPYMAGAGAVKGLPLIPRIIAGGGIDSIITGAQTKGDTGATIASGLSGAAASALPGGTVVKGIIPRLGRLAGEVAPGYVSDVALGVAGQRGEDRTGFNAAIPGAGSFLTGGLAGTSRLFGKTKSIIAPSERELENKLLERFTKGVRPLLPGKTTPSQLGKYNDDVITGARTILENKPNLKFTDDLGEEVLGQKPESLQQFADSIEQTKKTIFSKYDALAKQAGKAGMEVDTVPIASELDSVINNKALGITNPNAVKYAQGVQKRYLDIGKLDATTAQDVIQNYNKSLEAFYRNPSYDTASQAAIDAMLANRIRKSLDEGITGLTGIQYQQLKNQYGALKNIERDVIKASLRDARKNVKGLIDFTDIFTGGQIVNGILSMNPATLAQGLGARAIKEVYKTLNNPNRAIRKMFDTAEKLPQRFNQSTTPGKSLLQAQPKPNITAIPSKIDIQPTIPKPSKKSSLPTKPVRVGNAKESMSDLKSFLAKNFRESPIKGLGEDVRTGNMVVKNDMIAEFEGGKIPTYAQAEGKIQPLGGYVKIDEMPLPQRNVYGADQLAQSLGLDKNFLYETATKKGIDLSKELTKFDELRSSGKNILTLSNNLMTKLTETTPVSTAKPSKLPGNRGVISPRALTSVAGASAGATTGIERDEQGKLKYNVQKGLLGAAVGGAVGASAGKGGSITDDVSQSPTFLPKVAQLDAFERRMLGKNSPIVKSIPSRAVITNGKMTDSRTGLPLKTNGLIDEKAALNADSPYFNALQKEAEKLNVSYAKYWPKDWIRDAKMQYIAEHNNIRGRRLEETGSAFNPLKKPKFDTTPSFVRNRLDEMYSKAPEAKIHIDKEADKIVSMVPGTKVAKTAVKSLKRSTEKVMREYSGDADQLKDLARNSIIVDTPEAKTKVVELMRKRSDFLNEKPQKPEDYYGYEGVLYRILSPNGLVSETQVVSPKMTYGKNTPEFSKAVLGQETFEKIKKETGVEPGLGHKILEDIRVLDETDSNYAQKKALLAKKSLDYYSKLR